MNYKSYGDLSAIPFLHPFGLFLLPFLLIVVVWTLVLKGLALWRAAHKEDKVWFVILLVVNTCGILELIYLLWASKLPSQKTPTVAQAGPSA